MCGIAAAVGDVSVIDGLVRAVEHRGPDQSGSVAFERFAVGAARLRVSGDGRADQPIVAADRVALVANAEVFNHADLREPWCDPAEGDLPPLARRLAEGVTAALGSVRGPFAIAAFDRRLRLLALARDEWGVRPLHVAASADGLAASSEIWPLRSFASGGGAVDSASLAHLIAFQFLPPGRTLFSGIESVLPGEVRLYDAQGRLARRERVHFEGAAEPDLHAALRRAAALQGPRGRKAGAFLSGGLDSSAVVALLHDAGHVPDVGFTGFFPEGDPTHDERPHARAVASALSMPLVEVPIRAADALEAFPSLIRALGGPLAGPGGLAQLVLSRAAAREGVRVVYSGEGGDELFGGYERHRLLQRIEAREPLDPLPGYGPLARRMASAQDPLAAAVFRGGELLPLLCAEMRREVADAAFAALPPPGAGRADRALAFEQNRFLPGLLAVDDATLSAFGIEGRPLLLDPVVGSLAARLPIGTKSPSSEPRRTFRSAMGRLLPAAAAARRDKMGFPMPLDVWLATPPWRDYALDRIGRTSLVRFGFAEGRVREAIEAQRLSARAAWFLLALDVLDQWTPEAS